MSQISQMLRDKAEEIRLSSPTEVAVGLLKQAGMEESDARIQLAQFEMEKAAAEVLTQAGVDIEKAASMVRASGVKLKDLISYEQAAEEIHPSVELLKQAAAYIDALESELGQKSEALQKSAADLQKSAADLSQLEQANALHEIQLPEPIIKAASVGNFTYEDLEELQRMDQGTLHKIASAMETPWEMGSPVGVARQKTDPILDFVFSDTH